MRVRNLVLGIALLLAWPVFAATDTVCLLHTNDLHDHLRAGYEGVGGMAYVSGYVKSVRDKRKDVLLLDAGDAMEKGDMVAYRTKSAIMYEAIDKIGYDGATIGNHDDVYGFAQLGECIALAPKTAFLCTNPNGPVAHLVRSKVFDVDGVNVGVIGVTKSDANGDEASDEVAKDLAAEAASLAPNVHLLVAVCHLGSGACQRLSEKVPAINVFVTGHTHEALAHPKKAESTGALLVQAGDYACNVGKLDMTIDLDSKKIVSYSGDLVELRHDAVPCDTAMREWIAMREQEICPEATRVIGHCDKTVGAADVARLAAVAMREKAGTDIAFCHPGVVMRAGLPAGAIDVNALFRTGGQRGDAIVGLSLTGAQIEAYMAGLVQNRWGRTVWAGFDAKYHDDGSAKTASVTTDLKPDATYRVAMPELEWKSRLHKMLERGKDAASAMEVTPCNFSFTDALCEYIQAGKTEKIKP